MSKDYFASDPNPGGASSGADYFADDPVPVVDDSIKPTLTTDQGTSLIPIEGGDFFNMLSSYANRIGIANLLLEAQAQMLKDQGEESPVIEAQNQLEKTLKLFTQENLRIENVLSDPDNAWPILLQIKKKVLTTWHSDFILDLPSPLELEDKDIILQANGYQVFPEECS